VCGSGARASRSPAGPRALTAAERGWGMQMGDGQLLDRMLLVWNVLRMAVMA
jgi:hypothetical protein